jgi:eukaryotic-like serine/threonine-protein kinase
MTRSASEPLLKPGSTLAGKYRVERVLGEGGMGVVLQAHHLQLDERVAIKVPHLEALTSPEAVGRFLREARAAVKIKSEHVARVNDVGTLETGQPYIVMEFLEGVDLASWLQSNGPLPVEQAVEFVLQACEALAEAHALEMVHRDLKPANLFCIQRRDGSHSIKVLDFGISKLGRAGSSSDASITSASSVMGSPLYMSPEQLQSTRDVDARSDIWSMGVVVYELLTGKLPFEADTLMGLGVRIAHSTPPLIRGLRSDVPRALEQVVFQCLEKERTARYNDVAELARALHEFAPARARASVERITRVLKGGAALAGTLSQQPTSAPGVAAPDSIPSDQLPHARTRQSAPPLVAASLVVPGRTPNLEKSAQSAAPIRKGSARGAGTTAANAPVSSDAEQNETQSPSARLLDKPAISQVRVAGLAGASVLALGLWLWLRAQAPAPQNLPVTREVVLAPASSQASPPASQATAIPSLAATASAPLAEADQPDHTTVNTDGSKQRQLSNVHGKQSTVSPNPKKPAPAQPVTLPARIPAPGCDPPYTLDEKGDKRFKAECF